MTLIDLTMPMGPSDVQWDGPGQTPRRVPVLQTRIWHLDGGPAPYAARVHYLTHWGMAATYIDFPGHIVETDDGQDAASVPAAALFRVPALVLRLDRSRQPGPIAAAELQAACPSSDPTPGLVVNALGACRFDDVPERSVYLARDAVRWIIERGTRLLVADVYESSTDPQDVFRTLFCSGVATVCHPAALGVLRGPRARLTALPLRVVGATQVPCRLLAELPARRRVAAASPAGPTAPSDPRSGRT